MLREALKEAPQAEGAQDGQSWQHELEVLVIDQEALQTSYIDAMGELRFDAAHLQVSPSQYRFQ